MKLHELHINDFKFFSQVEGDSPLLKIDGNHLLVYGENGSGKSTIYWALYTLLECSFKKSDDEVRKYFKKTGDESLVNIHATGTNNTYVKTILKDALGNPKTYRVSRKSSDMSIRANTDIRESNMASDFINYRVLFKLHSSKHSNKNNLWNWFLEEVFPYVKKSSDPCLIEFEALKEGPTKFLDLNGNQLFPTASLQDAPSDEEKIFYRNYRDYKQKWVTWHFWLETFLTNITTRANDLINHDFKYNFKIGLNIIKKFPTFQATDDKIKWTDPEIIISITEYEGIQNPAIKKPHTFLNEAKWSAIGLSLRFAILETRLYTADLKILVIDDMILSLDMCNRDVLLDIILNNYVNDYQIILLTHDRFFYELAKSKIAQNGIANWKYLEMFEDSSGTFPKPLIIEKTNQISKVWQLYHGKEFSMAANCLRKATEKLCNAYLSRQERINVNYSVKNLHEMLEAFRTKGMANGLNQNNLIKLIEYKNRILNPSSHYDIETPLFETELKRAIETIEALSIEANINV
ncbi:hypothetical protein EI546_03685 [Aequorivita sp. H23M31]|uniref:Rad50/SbcC-type AAA domain-containing protein n=1 Tax=Aequorivita ciconiae TaxID=2494375 RepID=A0A410G0W4_9FLAO|nr:ATP-binding protein [Aequorivita sp. H23M31]QAA80885.1 hypothetical protein EI546_03685 [Aequorivita sp. H23M31]